MIIAVVNERLSDGSRVYDMVVTLSDGEIVRMPCRDEACAIVFADMLCDMVNDFTTIPASRAWRG